jgi:ribosomal protein L17
MVKKAPAKRKVVKKPVKKATGGSVKSTVNSAGNYTKPTMRKNLFNKIKASSKGGSSGQWSGRKAQMLAKEYKAKGGGYRD